MEFCLCSWQNNKKIGPILAINSEDFNQKYVVKKLIKGLPLEQKSIEIKGLSTNSKKIKKGFIFLQLRAINLMVKNT